MIEQIKSLEIKEFIKKNPKTVLLDVRTEEEWNTVGKPISDSLGIKTFFITISQDPGFVKNVKKQTGKTPLEHAIAYAEKYNPNNKKEKCVEFLEASSSIVCAIAKNRVAEYRSKINNRSKIKNLDQ